MTDESVVQLRESVTVEELREVGVDIDQDFPDSQISDFKRYPVLSEGGWYIVIKNQKSLESVSREPWKLLGPIPLLSDNLELD